LSEHASLVYKKNLTTTVSQELIDKQIDQERLQIHIGKNTLQQNTIKAENRAYASSAIYGISSIQELIPYVEAELSNIKTRIHKGKNGAAFK